MRYFKSYKEGRKFPNFEKVWFQTINGICDKSHDENIGLKKHDENPCTQKEEWDKKKCGHIQNETEINIIMLLTRGSLGVYVVWISILFFFFVGKSCLWSFGFFFFHFRLCHVFGSLLLLEESDVCQNFPLFFLSLNLKISIFSLFLSFFLWISRFQLFFLFVWRFKVCFMVILGSKLKIIF